MKVTQFHFVKKALTLVWETGKSWIIVSFLVRIVLGLIPIVSVLLIQNIINEITLYFDNESKGLRSVIWLLLLQFGMLFFQSAVINLMKIFDLKIEQKLDYKLEKQISNKAASVPLYYYDNTEFHHHHDRVMGNSGERMMSPIRAVLDIGQNVITLISFFVFLIQVHWLLAFTSTLMAIPVLVVQGKYGNKQFRLLRYQTPSIREAHYLSALLNDRESAKEIRLFNLKNHLLDRWSRLFIENNKKIFDLSKRRELAHLGLQLFTAIIYVFNAFFLIRLLKTTTLKIGDFVGVMQAVQGTQNTITDLSIKVANIFNEFLYIQDLFSFLEFEDPSMKIARGEKDFPSSMGQGIEFKNVSFTYPHSKRDVLSNVSFIIRPGEKIAIVGENGSGKTTLVKCLMGLYPVSRGGIFFDSVSIKDIKQEELFKNLTVIFQDFMKYNMSVKDNITISLQEDAKNELKMIDVAKQTGVDSFVSRYERRYETILGKILFEGEDLSGGQWQKIALARALFKNGQIFVLDEPTAALDPKAELEVFKQFEVLSKQKTTIYISHRMASARIADRILVMKNGELVEMGHHDELMGNDSEYARLFNMQAKWYA
jgi:ATP-binding cassette, subfamily B, bacterial